mgnify:FL=1|jgi:hypothetical protein|tara:strand:- start:389 stop:682 length:294 start_codon:yes stop_codon:yes gene_type:complete
MSEETKTAEAQAAPAGVTPQAGVSTAPIELTVQDLGVLRSIIDVASQRGAFKANEMEAVGKTFNKLDAFLQTVQKAEDEAKASKEGTAPAEAPKGDA